MKAVVESDVGYRLHLLGLGGGTFEVQPGYLRTEEKLRRNVPRGLVAWSTVDEALVVDEVPATDRAWFAKRFEAGEGREASALVEAIGALGWSALPDVRVVVSPALRPVPCLAPATSTVAVGPGTTPSITALGAFALPLEARFPTTLAPEVRRFAAWMAAGSIALPHLSSAALDLLLIDATQHLLPPQHRRDELERTVRALTDARLLDQPPGEIDRTIHGLGRRRADRLHRAWNRGFFLPRQSL